MPKSAFAVNISQYICKDALGCTLAEKAFYCSQTKAQQIDFNPSTGTIIINYDVEQSSVVTPKEVTVGKIGGIDFPKITCQPSPTLINTFCPFCAKPLVCQLTPTAKDAVQGSLNQPTIKLDYTTTLGNEKKQYECDENPNSEIPLNKPAQAQVQVQVPQKAQTQPITCQMIKVPDNSCTCTGTARAGGCVDKNGKSCIPGTVEALGCSDPNQQKSIDDKGACLCIPKPAAAKQCDKNAKPGDPNACSTASGISCNPKTGELQDKGEGILTAIGCVPTQPQPLVEGIIKFTTFGSGAIALLLMIFASFRYITSAGNPDSVKAAWDQFQNAFVGLLFILFSVLLLQIIGVDILGIPGLTS